MIKEEEMKKMVKEEEVLMGEEAGQSTIAIAV